MELYKRNFVKFLLDSHALKFGDFTLKSGRKSPFFMNMGDLNTGYQLMELGKAYAAAVAERFDDFEIVFGPAYKAISLAAITAEALARNYRLDHVRYCSNRKEIKDHGDGGILVGAKPKDGDRVVIVEDVTTSGKSIEETIPILKAQAKVEVIGLVVSFDRMEFGHDKSKTALEEISEKYGIQTTAIASMKDVMEYLQEQTVFSTDIEQAVRDYYAQYGVKGKEVV